MCNTENLFLGKNIYLVGGGNSFSPKLAAKLPRDRVVCINSSYIFFSQFLALFWMDYSWYQKNSHKIHKLKDVKLYNISRYNPFSVRLHINWIRLHSQDYKEYKHNRDGEGVIGNNTGAAVIDYLDKMKANKIFLLGFDCKRVNGKSHSHSEYRFRVNDTNYESLFVPCFEELSRNLQHSKVYNCSAQSALKCFEYRGIERILKEDTTTEDSTPL